MNNNTAKHFVLQLGSLISLYLSLSFLIVLLFGVINILFPDAIESYWEIESATSSIRLGIAMLFVFFPTYLVLTRLVNKERRHESTSAYLGLTKWLIYLSLLVGGGVLLGDLVAVIMTFLDGELTQRFILKATTVLVVVGAAFYYYLQDARGVWLKEEKGSIYFGAGATVVVLASLIYGFMHIETPAVVREMRLDQTQITDLQQIQYRLEGELALSTTTIPATLDEAYDGFPVPVAPEDRVPYSYEVTDKGFNLCATFYSDSPASVEVMFGDKFMPSTPVLNANDWSYKKGRYCFERIVKQ